MTGSRKRQWPNLNFFRGKLAFLLLLVGATAVASTEDFVEGYCAIDASIYCERPANAAALTGGNLTWTTKSHSNRKALMNSFDVQKDARGCAAFAQLLKTECALPYPVMAVFSAGAVREHVTSFATGFDRLMACNPDLSPAFLEYFKGFQSNFPPPVDKCPGSDPLAAPQMVYAPNSVTLSKGVPLVLALQPRLKAGSAPTSCTVTPTLPAGLVLDTKNCNISGNPSVLLAKTTYTVKPANSAGTGSATISLTVVNGVAPNIAFSGSSFSITRKARMTPIKPNNTGGGIAECTISPALPSGLFMSTANCSIEGIPTMATSAKSYTVTAKNAYGSRAATISLTVLEALPSISYPYSPFVIKMGAAMTTRYPAKGGGAITSCSSSPALPTGLILNQTTCAIGGTPTVAQALKNYTITATNSRGSDTAIVGIAIYSTAPHITYSGSPYTTEVGFQTARVPTNSGGLITACSSNPTLPKGLYLDQTTCSLQGAARYPKAAANYTITAANGVGSSSTTVSISVVDSKPNLGFDLPLYSAVVGDSFTVRVNNYGGFASHCTVSPSLPSNVTLYDPSEDNPFCHISGSVSVAQTAKSYTISATNSHGSGSAIFTLEAKNMGPSIVYDFSDTAHSKFTFYKDRASGMAAVNDGSPVTSCTITPALPTGVVISNTTCGISGTATIVQAPKSYTVTARNNYGTQTIPMQIEVVTSAPDIQYLDSNLYWEVGTYRAVGPVNTKGLITNCTVTPALPAGLNLSTDTCSITGTATAVSDEKEYKITATNSYGSDTETIGITVINK